jgi:magnesium transporter
MGDEPSREAPERSMRRFARRRPEPAAAEGSVVNSVLYRDGRAVSEPATLAEAVEGLGEAGCLAWIGLYRPPEDQLLAVAERFGLHQLAVEDAIVAHQRPKLERYGDTLFAVLRPARYLDETEQVDFGELHVFVGPGFVITVRHSETPDLAAVRARMEGEPDLLGRGPEAVLYAVLDAVVDDYAPVVAGLRDDVDEIENQVFSGDPQVSRRIYQLSREVIDFQRATAPLLDMLSTLEAALGDDEELRRSLRDVTDHATTVVERADDFRALLTNVLTVNGTLVSQAQNEEIKKILFAPTLIGTVYGMNFVHMPELRWLTGYPFAITLMLLTCAGLYLVFRKRRWL